MFPTLYGTQKGDISLNADITFLTFTISDPYSDLTFPQPQR